jgi:hypothetical protein
MADNVILPLTGSGDAALTVAGDDVGGIFYQRVKIVTGADGAVSADGTALPVAGDVAHDAADSGSPQKIGGKARQTNPTAVADGDRVDAAFDDVGRQAVVPYGVRDLVGHQHTEIASSAAETTIVTAGAAGVFQDILSIVLSNQTATATVATLRDATGGTTRMKVNIPVSGTLIIPLSAPMKQAVAANNWTLQLVSAAVTVDIFVQFVSNV